MPPSRLAERLSCVKSNITQLVDRLEVEGLVKRADDPEDRRSLRAAVRQELQGLQSILTVGSDNKVLARSILTAERVGERWIVLQGLKPGDRVIV